MITPASIPYVIFGYWLSVFLLQVPTFFSLSFAMYKKRDQQLAFPFILYLCTVLIESFSTLVSTSYTIINWRPDSGGYDPSTFFFVGFVSFAFVPVTSTAVFFLLLHRIIVVSFFNSKKIDSFINYIALIVVILMAILNSTYVILKFLYTVPTLSLTTKCWIIHCTWGEYGSVVHQWSRLVFGFANIFLGILFLVVLNKTSANLPCSKKANRLTLITITSELILSFLPMAVDLFLSNYLGINMVQRIGPWGFLTCAVDAFIVSIIYTKFFLKSQKSFTVINSSLLML